MKALTTKATQAEDPTWTTPSIPDRHSAGRGGSAAFWAFVCAQGLIFVGLVWNFHGRWFVADEWQFLAGRTAGNLSSLFSPYQEHWSTLPILYYRLLWHFVGIRSYLPYLVSVLALHIAIGFLLRYIMVRAGTLPWIATLFALIFSLYGTGYSDISYGFNIGFDGSVLFGLLFLIAVGHPGPLGRRDLLGVAAGVAGLMCSGIGVAMVIVVAIALWIQHTFRRALLIVLPLAAIYLMWFAAIGHTSFSRHASLPEVARFTVLGIGFAFSSLGQSPVIGALLALLLIAGVAIAIRRLGVPEFRDRLGIPLALLLGAVAFMVLIGFARADNTLPSGDTYAASRYVYVEVAMLIPILSVGASQMISRWRTTLPLVGVVVIFGIPGNIAQLHQSNYLHTLDSYRQFVLTIPRLPIAKRLPRSVHPDPYFDDAVTIGWLLDGVRSGRVPAPSPPASEAKIAYWTLRLAWLPGLAVHDGGCATLKLPTLARVESGTRMTIHAPVDLAYVYRPHHESNVYELAPYGPSTTFVSYWPMELSISSKSARQSVQICDGSHPSES